MKRVKILLSTYNGEDFIREQINSLTAQEGIDSQILVRDDGSTDGTLTILQELSDKGVLDFYTGENMGPARSFMDLLSKPSEADYFAFSDQDDVWLPDKLSTAVKALENSGNKTCIYLGQPQPTDSQLHRLPYQEVNPLGTFGESLVYEFAAGCTMVISKSLRDLIVAYQPHYLSMHDVWVYSVALALGAEVHYDHTPHILYRQHDNNTIGQTNSFCTIWKRRLRRLTHAEQSRSRRALEIKKGYYDRMSPIERDILDLFIGGKTSFNKRLRLLRDHRYECGNPSTARLFALSLLLNQY